MKLKLRNYTDMLLEGKFHENEKMQFREDIKNFGRFGEHIYNSRGMSEVVESIKSLAERAQEMALDEAGDEGWFEAVTVKKNMNEVKKDAQLFEKTAKEMHALQQRMEALYEDIAHKIGRYYEVGELSGKEVLPADNDYTANGEQPEEENDDEQYQLKHMVSDEGIDEQFWLTPRISLGNLFGGKQDYTKPQMSFGDMQPDMDENFSHNTGNKTGPGNQGGTGPTIPAAPGGMAGLTGAGNAGQQTMALGDLMSDEEIRNVKENYWTLQGAQTSLMEDDADEGTPGMANVNQSTEWKARNESRADFFARMKEQLETL